MWINPKIRFLTVRFTFFSSSGSAGNTEVIRDVREGKDKEFETFSHYIIVVIREFFYMFTLFPVALDFHFLHDSLPPYHFPLPTYHFPLTTSHLRVPPSKIQGLKNATLKL